MTSAVTTTTFSTSYTTTYNTYYTTTWNTSGGSTIWYTDCGDTVADQFGFSSGTYVTLAPGYDCCMLMGTTTGSPTHSFAGYC